MNNNPFSCRGEISRLSFIITTLILLIPAFFIYGGADVVARGIARGYYEPTLIYIVWLIWLVVCFLPFLFACAKRFRNIGKNPYLCLLALIPLMPIILWFYLAIKAPAKS